MKITPELLCAMIGSNVDTSDIASVICTALKLNISFDDSVLCEVTESEDPDPKWPCSDFCYNVSVTLNHGCDARFSGEIMDFLKQVALIESSKGACGSFSILSVTMNINRAEVWSAD